MRYYASIFVALAMLNAVAPPTHSQSTPIDEIRTPQISETIKSKVDTKADVGPKQPLFENDFNGAQFIWSDDLAFDSNGAKK